MPEATGLTNTGTVVPSQRKAPRADLPTFVYRFFDAAGTLLYVGITMGPYARWTDHQLVQPWWTDVENIVARRYPTRLDALIEEDRAIREEGPMYNRRNSRATPKDSERGPGRPEVGKPINWRPGDDLLARVDAEAKRRDIKRADLLREAVDSYLTSVGA